MSALCSVADVQAYTGQDSANLTALITTLIGNASTLIESICSRVFEQTTYTETRNGNGAPMLFLRQGPIISVSSLQIDGVSIPAATSPVSYGYVFDDRRLYLRGNAGISATVKGTPGGYPIGFSRGVQNIAVQYIAGYATIPADLNQACVELVADMLAKRARIDLKSQSLGQNDTVSYNLVDVPPRVKKALRPYALPMIPS